MYMGNNVCCILVVLRTRKNIEAFGAVFYSFIEQRGRVSSFTLLYPQGCCTVLNRLLVGDIASRP
jgi:hypothetical protein